MIEVIDDWRDAPLWTQESIAEATKAWFKHLGKSIMKNPSVQTVPRDWAAPAMVGSVLVPLLPEAGYRRSRPGPLSLWRACLGRGYRRPTVNGLEILKGDLRDQAIPSQGTVRFAMRVIHLRLVSQHDPSFELGPRIGAGDQLRTAFNAPGG